MHAQKIASRLLSKHGMTASKRKVTYRMVVYRRLLECMSHEDLPYLYARLMLWKSVRHHLINS